jgi:hypothetical protein
MYTTICTMAMTAELGFLTGAGLGYALAKGYLCVKDRLRKRSTQRLEQWCSADYNQPYVDPEHTIGPFRVDDLYIDIGGEG